MKPAAKLMMLSFNSVLLCESISIWCNGYYKLSSYCRCD